MVIGVPDDKWGEMVTAFVVTKPEADVDAEAVIARARTALGGYKVPKKIVFCAELPKNVVPFHRKPAFKWVAQAAAVALMVGGGYFAGAKRVDTTIAPTPALVERAPSSYVRPVSLAETRVLDAETLSPEIQGRPNISNLQFIDADATDQDIAVSFDVTSRWTVNGNPRDKSMVRLLSYILEHDKAGTPRNDTLEWVRQTYSDPAYADPEIARSLAKVLRERIEAQEFGRGGRAGLRLTTSIGVATFPSPLVESTEDLFGRADAALYRAKADGRNRVCT